MSICVVIGGRDGTTPGGQARQSPPRHPCPAGLSLSLTHTIFSLSPRPSLSVSLTHTQFLSLPIHLFSFPFLLSRRAFHDAFVVFIAADYSQELFRQRLTTDTTIAARDQRTPLPGRGLNQASSLIFQPSTLHPQFSTLNTQLSIRNSQPSTLVAC